MKKAFFAMLMLAAVMTTASAAEKQPGFFVQIIPTKSVNIADQFAGILSHRPPFFPKVSHVVCGEPFEVEITFIGAKIRDGAVKLAGKLIMTDPQGRKTELPLHTSITNVSGDASGVFLFPQSLRVVYEPKDIRGKYTFDAELTDCYADRTARASTSVKYVKKTEAKPGIKAFDELVKYYTAPCPECIIPAFREFLANLPKQRDKEKDHFNPLPQLAFFYFLLKENPQCVPEFAEFLKTLPDEGKHMAATVLNFASEASARTLTQNQRDMFKKQFPSDPFHIEKATAAWHLDVCWAEFFVRGTKAPVMKIVQAMSLAEDSMTIEDYKKIARPTREDQRKLLNGLTVMAAQWSLKSLAKEHSLVRYYVEAALVRGEVKNPIAGALAAKAIGMEVQLKKK